MDSLFVPLHRSVASSSTCSRSDPRKQFHFLRNLPNVSFLRSRVSLPLHDLDLKKEEVSERSSRIVCAVSSTETREEKRNMSSKSRRGKVRLNLRLDHQVKFGEHVVILGSAKELGSWKKNVPMKWTEKGWVCELELKGGESIEYKFVIVSKDKNKVWEGGDNRVLKLPMGGSFTMVCIWNATGESVNLLPLGSGENEENYDLGDNGSVVTDAATHLEAGTSPFVGQWQGKAISFMQSNEHRNRSFYKHILGVKVTYHDIEAIDPDYYKNLKWMLENDISDVLHLTFSIDADEEKLILYERTEVTDYELIPGGRNIKVTEEEGINKEDEQTITRDSLLLFS